MHKELPVSIVIPCMSYAKDLEKVLKALQHGSCIPREIIVIASSCLAGDQERFNMLIEHADDSYRGRLRVFTYASRLYPGAARNRGIELSRMDWIAFLDVKTIPGPGWLKNAWRKSQDNSVSIVCGSTRYVSKERWGVVVISATYGFLPLRTVPGTLIERKMLDKIGYFIPHVRAGEDTDWMNRIKLLGLRGTTAPDNSLTYSRVPDNAPKLIRKWYENYRSCAPMVHHLERQKMIYISALYTVLLLFAFNWNGRMAGWNTESSLYIKDVTKVVAYLCLASYIGIRSLVMPLRRGVPLWWLLQFRWMYVGLVCLVLDITKVVAFVSSLLKIRL